MTNKVFPLLPDAVIGLPAGNTVGTKYVIEVVVNTSPEEIFPTLRDLAKKSGFKVMHHDPDQPNLLEIYNVSHQREEFAEFLVGVLKEDFHLTKIVRLVVKDSEKDNSLYVTPSVEVESFL